LCDKGLTTEALQCLNQSDLLQAAAGCTTEDDDEHKESAVALADLWSILWLPSSDAALVNVVGEVPIARDIVSVDALEQAKVEGREVTVRVTSRSNFSGNERYRFVTYWPVMDATDSRASVQAVLQQVHEVETPLHTPQQIAMQMGLRSAVSHVVNRAQRPQQQSRGEVHYDTSGSKSPPKASATRPLTEGAESMVLTSSGLTHWANLFNCADSFEAECELNKGNAQYLAEAVSELLTGSVASGCNVAVVTKFAPERGAADTAFTAYARRVGSDEAVERSVAPSTHLW
jgi:hypothetical protein